MKNWKHLYFVSIQLLFMFVLIVSCSNNNGNRLSGTYEVNHNFAESEKVTETYNFSGKNYIRTYTNIQKDPYPLIHWEQKGTYSITNDKIEFILPDGKIRVCLFSYTENTVIIDGKQFNKK